MSTPTTLLGLCHAKEVIGYYPVGVQGTVLGIPVDFERPALFAPPVSWSLPSGRPRSVGPSQLWLCQSEKSYKQRFGVSSVGDTGRSRKRCIGQAFRSERRAGVGSRRRFSLARPFSRRLDRPSGLSFRYLGRPRSCASFATSSTGPSLCWEASP